MNQYRMLGGNRTAAQLSRLFAGAGGIAGGTVGGALGGITGGRQQSAREKRMQD